MKKKQQTADLENEPSNAYAPEQPDNAFTELDGVLEEVAMAAI